MERETEAERRPSATGAELSTGRTWRRTLALGSPHGQGVGGLRPVLALQLPRPREDQQKARPPSYFPHHTTLSSCPESRPDSCFQRGWQNGFLSQNSSANISQSRSENLSSCIMNCTEELFVSQNPRFLSAPTLEGGLGCPCSPEATSRPKQKVGETQNFVRSLLHPGASAEQSPFMPSPMLGARGLVHPISMKGHLVSFCNQGNLGPKVRKMVQGPKPPVLGSLVS